MDDICNIIFLFLFLSSILILILIIGLYFIGTILEERQDFIIIRKIVHPPTNIQGVKRMS